MSKVLVYTDGYKPVDSYVGMWYDTQYQPQEIYLGINEHGAEIDYSGIIGNAVPEDVFNNRTIRFVFPEIEAIPEDYIDEILKDLDPWIEELICSYDEDWTNGNLIGKWSAELCELMQERVDSWAETIGYLDIGFVEEEELEEELAT